MFNDVYLGEKNLEEEIIREVKKITYNICKSMIDPLIGKISNKPLQSK